MYCPVISQTTLEELLRLKDGRLFHREGQELEFKEQFNFAGLADHFRDFAAFANNRGGVMVFGVQDSPRVPIGLTEVSHEQFNKIDPARITGYLLETFSSNIIWSQASFVVDGKRFGVFEIGEASVKPVIAKKNEGKDQQITNGSIYYRYAGRTQAIQYAELEAIIERRVERNNRQWLDLMAKIGRAGPQNAAVLDTQRALIEKDEAKVLVLDEGLAKKIKFIREGDFSEKSGAATLKLVGDVVPIDRVEVIRMVKENLTRQYPLSAMELVEEVKKVLPYATTNHVWAIVKENKLKSDPAYSAYNFRNKRQEDVARETGVVPPQTPSIYNQAAVDFIVNVLRTAKAIGATKT
jgi:hypothetical protein